MVFLQSYGVSTQYAIRIYKTYGPAAVKLVRENPYRLALDIHGIGFKSADRIAMALGIDPAAPQRLEAGVLHLLSEAGDRGHLFLPRRTLAQEAAALLAAPAHLVDKAIGSLSENGQVVVEPSAAAPDERGRGRRSIPRPCTWPRPGIATRIRDLLIQPSLPFEIDVERALDWFEKTENGRARRASSGRRCAPA